MSSLLLDQITKRYGLSYAIDEVCLSIASGEFVTLLGPSGCGKSTTLRAVAGLNSIDSGTILIGETDVTNLPIHRRDIGMVFQNLALFPHMSVADNIGFGLRMRGMTRAERDGRIIGALDLVRLSGYGERLPAQLSGGQQQRVAIARAMVFNPKVMLLDEPFSALDRKLREEMQAELREITRRVGITSIFVTHDQEEALTLSDRIAVMNRGRIEQLGAPRSVFEAPETIFVADFMGAANLVAAEVSALAAKQVIVSAAGLSFTATAPDSERMFCGKAVTVNIRPERIAITRRGRAAADGPQAVGSIRSMVYQGAFTTFDVALHQSPLVLRIRSALPPGALSVAPGDAVDLSWRVEDALILREAPRGDTAFANPATKSP